MNHAQYQQYGRPVHGPCIIVDKRQWTYIMRWVRYHSDCVDYIYSASIGAVENQSRFHLPLPVSSLAADCIVPAHRLLRAVSIARNHPLCQHIWVSRQAAHTSPLPYYCLRVHCLCYIGGDCDCTDPMYWLSSYIRIKDGDLLRAPRVNLIGQIKSIVNYRQHELAVSDMFSGERGIAITCATRVKPIYLSLSRLN